MFFKIGFLKNVQFYLKNTATQVFSCEICETFGNSLFHRASLVAAFVISETESKNEKNIFTWTYSPENSSEDPPRRAVRKQLTVFFSNLFKITKVEGSVCAGRGRRNEQKRGYLAEIVTQRCFANKTKNLSEIFGKTHRKTPAKESFFSL